MWSPPALPSTLWNGTSSTGRGAWIMAPEGARNEYDVIVVGAGFGGPVAAKKCAEAGLRTLMLERGGRAGEKVISGLTISLIHISEPTRLGMISYAVFCLKKKKTK